MEELSAGHSGGTTGEKQQLEQIFLRIVGQSGGDESSAAGGADVADLIQMPGVTARN